MWNFKVWVPTAPLSGVLYKVYTAYIGYRVGDERTNAEKNSEKLFQLSELSELVAAGQVEIAVEPCGESVPTPQEVVPVFRRRPAFLGQARSLHNRFGRLYPTTLPGCSYSDSTKRINAFLSSLERFSTWVREASASPPCHKIASIRLRARPSCK